MTDQAVVMRYFVEFLKLLVLTILQIPDIILDLSGISMTSGCLPSAGAAAVNKQETILSIGNLLADND